jgi:hypothetical protein
LKGLKELLTDSYNVFPYAQSRDGNQKHEGHGQVGWMPRLACLTVGRQARRAVTGFRSGVKANPTIISSFSGSPALWTGSFTCFLIRSESYPERRRHMWTNMNRFILMVFLLFFLLGCNPVKEIREARDAAEKANRETKVALEKIKEYSERAEAAAQRAEIAAASSEDFSKKAEAASQKAVSSFEKRLKK